MSDTHEERMQAWMLAQASTYEREADVWAEHPKLCPERRAEKADEARRRADDMRGKAREFIAINVFGRAA